MPGLRNGIVYSPVLEDTVSALVPFSVSMAVIFTPGMAAPWVSVTMPLKVPRNSWAHTNAAKNVARQIIRASVLIQYPSATLRILYHAFADSRRRPEC